MRFFLLCFLIVSLAAISSRGQQSATKYTPTDIQELRLSNRRKDVTIAQILLKQAQADLQRSVDALVAESDKVKEENRWDKALQFDINTLNFSDPPAPPK